MRRIRPLLALVVAMALLAACGDDDDSATSAAGFEGTELAMVMWGGETADTWIAANADPFAAATGAVVLRDEPVDYSKVRAQVEAGQVTWDLIEGDPYIAVAECDTLFEPQPDVDQSNVKAQYQRVGDCYSPVGVFADILLYDTSLFGDDPPTDWTAYFDTARYPGKRAIFNWYYNGSVEAALLADGVSPEDLYPLDLDRAFDRLETIKQDLVFYDTLAQGVELMRSGAVVMAIIPHTRGYQAAQAGATFAPVWNQAFHYVDGWAIPKGSPDADAAKALLEYMLTPEAQAATLELLPIGATVQGVQSSSDPLIAEWDPSSPEHLAQGIVKDQAWYAEYSDEISERFFDWAAG